MQATNVVTSEEVTWEGKWIKSKLINWNDHNGVSRVWEGYERTTHKRAPEDGLFN